MSLFVVFTHVDYKGDRHEDLIKLLDQSISTYSEGAKTYYHMQQMNTWRDEGYDWRPLVESTRRAIAKMSEATQKTWATWWMKKATNQDNQKLYSKGWMKKATSEVVFRDLGAARLKVLMELMVNEYLGLLPILEQESYIVMDYAIHTSMALAAKEIVRLYRFWFVRHKITRFSYLKRHLIKDLAHVVCAYLEPTCFAFVKSYTRPPKKKK
jgi:hypothetical protein